MTTLDPRAEMTLELSRLTQEPRAADRARNLAALRARLGLPVPPATGLQQSSTTVERTRAPELGTHAKSPSAAPLTQLVLVAGVMAALGFFVGSGQERSASADPHEHASLGPAVPAAVAIEHKPGATFVEGTASAPPAFSDAVATRRPVSPELASAPKASVRPRSRAVSNPVAGAQRTRPQFLEAVRLLRRARSALGKGEAALAMALLDELDERFARDMLDEERGVTRVLALCASGDEIAAQKLAHHLHSAYPRSIYSYRLEQSCIGDAISHE